MRFSLVHYIREKRMVPLLTSSKVQLAQEAAHNINSPLVALEMIMPLMNEVPERLKKIQRNAITEIRLLSEKLKGRNLDIMKSSNVLEHVNLDELINELIEQKKIDSASKNIHFKYQNKVQKEIIVAVNRIEMRGILSNLIINSIESYNGTNGEVCINLYKNEGVNSIEIMDFGCGISKDILMDLGKVKVSSKSEAGRGIGVYSAYQKIKGFGGNLKIDSEINRGTRVSISLC